MPSGVAARFCPLDERAVRMDRWTCSFCLRFRHTFYVVAALIMFLGVVACVEMPRISSPRSTCRCDGDLELSGALDARDGAARHHLRQCSISSNHRHPEHRGADDAGLSVQKIYFQPDVNLDLAIAQIVSATTPSAP